MNKVVKRCFSGILSLVMIIGIVFSNGMTLESKAVGTPATVSSGNCGTGLTWTLDDEGKLTISGNGAMADYDLPGPGAIAPPWCSYQNDIKKIVIKRGVTSIGAYAFSDCSSLTSVEISSSVTSIGTSAFNNCISLTSVEIPSSVTSIGGAAFDNCSSLTSVEISSSVTSIGAATFANCSSLTSVGIPSSVTSIGAYAFDGCSLLTSVKIPSNVTSIGIYTFNNCISLTSVTILSSTPPSMSSNVFGGCNNLANIYVPDDSVDVYKNNSNFSSVSSKIVAAPVEETSSDESSCSNSSSSSSSSSSQAHTHNLEWVTTSAPTTEHDGTASLVCSSCGYVADTQTISRTAVVYQDITNKFETELSKADLVNVAAGTTVKIELGDWHSVPSNLMDKILNCKADVELTYRYKGVNYDIVIPAGKGIDLHIRWYGPLLMYSLYGKYSK